MELTKEEQLQEQLAVIEELEAENKMLESVLAKEWKRKEWLLFSKMQEFPDGSSSMIKHHLLGNEREGYCAVLAISSQPSGQIKHRVIAEGKTADEAIDAAMANSPDFLKG